MDFVNDFAAKEFRWDFLVFVENKGGKENGLAQEYETNAFGDASLKNHWILNYDFYKNASSDSP